MRIFRAMISIWVAVTTSCSAQEVSHYIRDLGAGSPVIIFLHGVLGDSKSTWLNGKVYWPELLAEDNSFSGTSIYVHEYNTELLRRDSLNIDELARELKVRFDAAGVMEHEPLIFIAHSMGGLVVRDFLLKYRDIANKTRFIFFCRRLQWELPLQIGRGS